MRYRIWILHFGAAVLAVHAFTISVNGQSNSSTLAPKIENGSIQNGKMSSSSSNTTADIALNPTPAAQSPNPYVNSPGTLPGLLGQFLPTALNALNPAEQQLSPLQLRNATPQQLAQLRRLQQLRALQQQQQGLSAFPGVDLIGSFLPGGQNNAVNINRNSPQKNNNRLNGGSAGGVNPSAYSPYGGGLGQLLGLTPPAQNGLVNTNPLGLGLAQQRNGNRNPSNGLNRLYGQPNLAITTPSPELANQVTQPEDEKSGNEAEGEAGGDTGGEEGSDNEGGGDGNAGEENAPNNAADPSQDPDMKQFSNLQGGENFPSDLFPPGILSENDLKDIQKSMDEQAKKEAEEKQQQEQAAGQEGDEAAGQEGDDTAGQDGAAEDGADAGSADDNANNHSGDANAAVEDEKAAVVPAAVPKVKLAPKLPATGYIANDLSGRTPNVGHNSVRGGTIDALNGYTGSNYRPPTPDSMYPTPRITARRPPTYDNPRRPDVNSDSYPDTLRSNVQYDNEGNKGFYNPQLDRPTYPDMRGLSNRGDSSRGRTANVYSSADRSDNDPTSYGNDLGYRRPNLNRDTIDPPSVYNNRQALNPDSVDRPYSNAPSLDEQLYGRNNRLPESGYDDLEPRNRLNDVIRNRGSTFNRYDSPVRSNNNYNQLDSYARDRNNDRSRDVLRGSVRQSNADLDNDYRYGGRQTNVNSNDYARSRDIGRDPPSRGYSYGSLGRRPYDAQTADQSSQVTARDAQKDAKDQKENKVTKV